MVHELGSRLRDAGLVTEAQLALALTGSPLTGGALARALVEDGVEDEALAGYFVASGHGPFVDAAQLSSALPAVLDRLGPAMSAALMALPVRETERGVLVAMADPSDDDAVAELQQALGVPVLPAVACIGDLRRAIDGAWLGRPDLDLPSQGDPPPIELVRKRAITRSREGEAEGYRAPSAKERAASKQQLKASQEPSAMPLVRTKAVKTGERASSPPRRAASKAAPAKSDAQTRAQGKAGKAKASKAKAAPAPRPEPKKVKPRHTTTQPLRGTWPRQARQARAPHHDPPPRHHGRQRRRRLEQAPQER